MFRSSFKKILKHPKFLKAVAWLLAQYMWVVFKTSRWQFIKRDYIEPYWDNNKPFILCFWHNRLAMMAFIWKKKHPIYMLISNHADGRIIADTVGFHGINTIGGSSSKGSSGAVRNLLRMLKNNYAVGITPDGPRGPRYSINPNLIQIAKKAKVDIVPVSYSITRRKLLSSWDRLLFPLPLSKGVFICGDPIKSENLEVDQAMLTLKKSLIEISDQADYICGHAPIPAPEIMEE